MERKKAHSLGVRKTVSVLSHMLSKPDDIMFTSNYIPLISQGYRWCSMPAKHAHTVYFIQ